MRFLCMLRIGVPAGVQGMIFSISNVVVQSSINSYGADAIAGSSAALNFEYYCYFIIQGFNGAAISFIAQNYGARRMDRVHRVFWICMGSSLAFCAAFNWLFAWQDDFFLGFFSDVPWCIISGLSACTLCWPVSLLPAVMRLPVHRCAEWGNR